MNKNLIKKLVENGTADMFGAFAETVKNEIASDDAKYENVGRYLLKALLDNNVDDVLRFLREAERKGIKSYHISSFLDWEYQFDKLASLDF